MLKPGERKRERRRSSSTEFTAPARPQSVDKRLRATAV
jgi:hypothetical protein